MNGLIKIAAFCGVMLQSVWAGTVVTNEITADELAAELGVISRKATFSFDKPVYAQAEWIEVVGGQPRKNFWATNTAKCEISFSFILRGQKSTDWGAKSVTLSFSNPQKSMEMPSLFRPSSGDTIYSARPALNLPLSGENPVSVLFFWLSTDAVVATGNPVEKLGRIQNACYLTLHFSPTPFK